MVPKSVMHDVHVERRATLILVYRFTYIAIWAILWQLATGTGQFPQTYKHRALSLPAESSRSISIGMLITP